MAFVTALSTLALSVTGVWYTFEFQSAAPETVVANTYQTPEESDPYVRFEMEAFDSIRKNYWKKASEADLAGLFQLSLEKATGSATPLLSQDRAGTAAMIAKAFSSVAPEKKKQLTIDTLIVALYNLPPVGRNQLLSQKQEKQLRQEVSNIDPNKDLYANVGASAGASVEEVKSAYEETKEILAASSSPAAKEQLAQAQYAYDVLTKEETKDRYDTAKVEPTIFTRIVGKTLYLYISKMSPTTFDEFVSAIKEGDARAGLDSMVIDLRGNIGGSLDISPYVLGLFMGQNQYLFDLYHQDDYEVIRSPIQKMAELKRYRDIAILTDPLTQSTAELIAASLKRFNLARIVGETTRGWGTVENTFAIQTSIDESESYAMLLVHSLTLRDDAQPIEGAGVAPDVSIHDADWKSQLSAHFRSGSLIDAVRAIASKPPEK